MTYSPQNGLGPFLPTSRYFPNDFDEFRVVFLQNYTATAQAVNIREVGIYDQIEIFTGEQWFDPTSEQKKRGAFRKVYTFGTINPAITATIPHGLTNVTSFTHIYGTCVTEAPDNRPIPFASTVAITAQIQVTVDDTNIYVINGSTAPKIDSGIIVLEYLKN